MKFLCLVLFLPAISYSQTDSIGAIKAIQDFQSELNSEYSDPQKSPLRDKAKEFKGHSFFPINLKFRVSGNLIRTDNSPFFKMESTGPKLQDYRVFGTIEFLIAGQRFSLPVYQSKSLMVREEYKDYLFLPFTDLTNGNKSYDGGRYIDLRIPTGEEIVIDFNQAYNPYCAYSDKYSCPIVPQENHLNVEILAGVRFEKVRSKPNLTN